MSINCMQPEKQQGPLISLSPEIIFKIMNCTDLPSIGRFKQTNKEFNFNDPESAYHITKFISPTTTNTKCFSSVYSQLKHHYGQCSSALIYLAKTPENKNIFQHLYKFHEQQRDQELDAITSRASLTPENKMKLYAGTYMEENNLKYLTQAIYYGLYDLVRIYIKPAANNLNIIILYPKYLKVAICNNDIKIAKLLIENGADVNAIIDKHLNTPLHITAERGHIQIAELLIANKANINAVDKYGYTPLHNATWKGHTGIAKLLIENGANINAIDKYEDTPLHNATWKGHIRPYA